MKKSIQLCICLVFYLATSYVCISHTASAGFLYGNGPANGEENAFFISDGLAVSDEFTLAAASTLDTIEFLAWVAPGDEPTSLDWLISSMPFCGGPSYTCSGPGAPLADHTDVSVNSSVFIANNDPGAEVNSVSFSAQNLTLQAGTYYLTLQNANDVLGDELVGWDENDGSSSAYLATVNNTPPPTYSGVCPVTDGTCNQLGSPAGSETFRIFGSPTPEPGTVTTLLSGLFLLAGTALYRARRDVLRQPLPQPARIQPRN